MSDARETLEREVLPNLRRLYYPHEADVVERYENAIREVLAELADCERDHPPEPWASELKAENERHEENVRYLRKLVKGCRWADGGRVENDPPDAIIRFVVESANAAMEENERLRAALDAALDKDEASRVLKHRIGELKALIDAALAEIQMRADYGDELDPDDLVKALKGGAVEPKLAESEAFLADVEKGKRLLLGYRTCASPICDNQFLPNPNRHDYCQPCIDAAWSNVGGQ